MLSALTVIRHKCCWIPVSIYVLVFAHPVELLLVPYLFYDLLSPSYVYHGVWNNGTYFTADIRRPTSVTNTFAFTFSRVYSWWCSLSRNRRKWTCLPRSSRAPLSVYSRRVATRRSTPDTPKWCSLFATQEVQYIQDYTRTLYLIKHYTALKNLLFSKVFISNIYINIKIYNKISSYYCIRFNFCSLVQNWPSIWSIGPAISRALSTLAYCDCSSNSEI